MAGAAPRLPFLWPTLWRSTSEVYNPAARSARAALRIRSYHPALRLRQQEPATQRYGTANEPPAHLGGGKGFPPATQPQNAEQAGKQEQPPASSSQQQQQEKATPTKALPKIGEVLQQSGEKEARDVEERQEEPSDHDKQNEAEPTTLEARLVSRTPIDHNVDAGKDAPSQPPPGSPKSLDDKPMDSVLESVPDPMQQQKQSNEQREEAKQERQQGNPSAGTELVPHGKAPHMDTPRHVHHFDTYGLVKHLAEGGWDERQAITIMKSVRLMLADNTDLANEALVSKSNLENEAYLFKAACAELKTEVVSRRRAEQEKMRTERGQLQHEVDILSQRLGQESTNMKDELKGLFDDRKMAVRNEQREMESKLQQLNQRITVSLQADARSDVEGLRWVMTRRVIIALATVVLMVLGSLKLFSNAAREAEESNKRRANQTSGGTQTDDFLSSPSNDGRPLAGADVIVKDGDNPAYVSLG